MKKRPGLAHFLKNNVQFMKRLPLDACIEVIQLFCSCVGSCCGGQAVNVLAFRPMICVRILVKR